MVFTPPKTTGLAIGLGGCALLLGLDGLLLNFLRTAPPSPSTFVSVCVLLASLPTLGWLGVRCFNLTRARYVLSRNALVVDWGPRREVIPLPSISTVRPGLAFKADLRPRGLTWPGYQAGSAEFDDLGEVEFLAASPQASLVLVSYPDGWLALSPSDPQHFIQTFEQLRAAGAEDAVAAESLTLSLFAWPLWQDRLALTLMALGALGTLALLGYLSVIAPQLPPEIALHFNVAGAPDRFGPPGGLFILPLIAALAWAFNSIAGVWLHRSELERPASYLLLGGTLIVAAFVWIAAIGLLTAG